jgi:hypothetical protein
MIAPLPARLLCALGFAFGMSGCTSGTGKLSGTGGNGGGATSGNAGVGGTTGEGGAGGDSTGGRAGDAGDGGSAGDGGTGGAPTGGRGGDGVGGSACAAEAGTIVFERGIGCISRAVTTSGTPEEPSPSLSPCAADGGCPDGKTCFRLTAQLAYCDVPQQSPNSAECSPACGAGQRCNPAYEGFNPCRPTVNYCFETSCASASDCGEGSVCTPPSLIRDGISYWSPGPPSVWAGRCLPRFCASDQECTRGPNGRCVLVNNYTGQGCHGGQIRSLSIACVYPGAPADPGACAGAWACGDGCFHLCPASDGGVTTP